MKTEVAQGGITLSSVDDAIELSMTPAICIVQADYDGRNPQLDKAVINLSLTQGSSSLKFTAIHVASSHKELAYEIIDIDDYSKFLHFTSIPTDVLEGGVTLLLQFKGNQTKTITIPYSVVREGKMYEWLEEWDSNTTEIAGEHIITPKIFAGVKSLRGELTGVYMGPLNGGAGLHGVHNGKSIFSIDHNGASIGGWIISAYGIQSKDNGIAILSEGSIPAKSGESTSWPLTCDGYAQCAKGHVRSGANGQPDLSVCIKA